MKHITPALCLLLAAALLGGCRTQAENTPSRQTEAPATETKSAATASAETEALRVEDTESDWEEESIAPLILEEQRAQVWDQTDQVFAWIPVPEEFYVDEEFSNRNTLVLGPENPDSLNVDVDYFVYSREEGYLDENMDDSLEEEAEILRDDPELSCEGPSPQETFTVNGWEMMGASLYVSYEPEHSAPTYTTEYVLWTRPSEDIIVSCIVSAASANPEPQISMEEAGRLFLGQVSAE